MRKMKYAHKILIRTPKWVRLLGSSRCKWESNIRMGLTEIVWEGMDWIHLAQDRDH
jgi:hypothetical protein